MSKDKNMSHVDRLLASRNIIKDKESIEAGNDIAQITSEQQSAVDFANAANEERLLRKGGGRVGGTTGRPRGGSGSSSAFEKCSNTTDPSTGEISEKCETNKLAVGGVVAAAALVAGGAAVAKYCQNKQNNGQER